MSGRGDHYAQIRGGRCAQTIEEGVFRSYLSAPLGEEISEFLDRNSDALTPDDIPEGIHKREIQQQIPHDHIL